MVMAATAMTIRQHVVSSTLSHYVEHTTDNEHHQQRVDSENEEDDIVIVDLTNTPTIRELGHDDDFE